MNKNIITLVLLFSFCGTATADEQSALNSIYAVYNQGQNKSKYCASTAEEFANKIYANYLKTLQDAEDRKKYGLREIPMQFNMIEAQANNSINILKRMGC